MLGELVVCAMLTTVLTLSFMLSPPDFSKPFIRSERPENHMAQIDFLRVFFCIGVLALHCENASSLLPSTPHAHGQSKLWYIIQMWGCCAVDCFFMVSGFLTTLKLLKPLSQGKPVERLKSIIERFLRLWPLLIFPAAWGLLRHDGCLYTPSGKLLSVKWVGWFAFCGNFFAPFTGMSWVYDLSFVPCWSLLVDFQATIILIMIIPLHYKWFGLQVWPLVVLTGVCAIVRMAVFLQDPDCFRIGYMSFAGTIGAASRETREFMMVTYGFDTVDKVLEGTCTKMMSEATANYMTKLYYPLHTRFASFVIGAAMAMKYFSVMQDILPWGEEFSKYGSKAKGRLLLISSFVWLWFGCASPWYSHGRSTEAFKEIFFHIFCSIACAIITFCAIVPNNHPFHTACIANFMGAKCFYVLGNASNWVYVLHWPILFEVVRWVKMPRLIGNLFIYLEILVLITLPIAILCMRFIDPPFEALRKSLMEKEQAPQSNKAEDSLKNIMATIKPHEAQHFLANLTPELARKTVSSLRMKFETSITVK